MADRAPGATVEILLIRHAKSDWGFEGVADADRPLNRRGLKDCLGYVPRLPGRIPRPDLLLVSPAARTMQTAQALVDAFALEPPALRVTPAIYEASAAAIVAALEQGGAPPRVIGVVGHNPGLNDLYTWLSGEPIDNLPTLAVAHLRAPVHAAFKRGGCAVVSVTRPRDFSA